MLNTLWLGFFITAAISALAQWLLGGQAQVFAAMVESLFAMAKLSVEVMVLLFGTLTLWLGFLRIAEKAGLVDALARWLAPLFARLMPGVPRGHPSLGLITLNFAANALELQSRSGPVLALSARAAACLTPAQRRALEQHTTLLPLAVPTIELAGGSVRCMLAGIHLAPRPSMAPASREASATSTNLIQIGT